MIYYIFKTQIFTVFLSIAHLTAITFPDKIQDYVGGRKGDFQIYELNQGKSLVYEVKRKDIDSNFITFHRGGKYHFNLLYDERFSNKDIEIKEAATCNMYELIKDAKDYQLFECPRSILFINKLKVPVKVNDQVISDKAFLSKGPPIFINGGVIYFNGMPL